MAGVGELLRNCGAFFIRRNFGGDKLYWAIVRKRRHSKPSMNLFVKQKIAAQCTLHNYSIR
jgi:hypothetical protein